MDDFEKNQDLKHELNEMIENVENVQEYLKDTYCSLMKSMMLSTSNNN